MANKDKNQEKDENTIPGQGKVVKRLKDGVFLIKVSVSPDKEIEIKATLSGKIRKNNIKIIESDIVTLAINKLDPSKSRITRRNSTRVNNFKKH